MLSFFDCFEINSLFLGYFIFSVNTPLNMCHLICSRAWSGETWIGKQCLELSKTLTNEVLTQYWIQFLILFGHLLDTDPIPVTIMKSHAQQSKGTIKGSSAYISLHLSAGQCGNPFLSELPRRGNQSEGDKINNALKM